MTTVSFNFDNNILYNSVVNGQLNTVQRLISSGSCDPNLPHSITGLRPIHFAASRGHVDLVQFLVQSSQVQIDSIDKEGEVLVYNDILFVVVLNRYYLLDCTVKSSLCRSFIGCSIFG